MSVLPFVGGKIVDIVEDELVPGVHFENITQAEVKFGLNYEGEG